MAGRGGFGKRGESRCLTPPGPVLWQRRERPMRDFQAPGRSLVYAANGLCATSHPLAAQVAVRMLQDGGNAVDAAIAAAVLLGFCEPPMCGLGGDAFVLLKPPGEERLVGLNGSGRAPAGLDAAALRAAGHADDAAAFGARRHGAGRASTPSCGCRRTGAGSGWRRASRRRSPMPRRACRSRRAPPATGTKRRRCCSGEARRFYLPGGRAPRAGPALPRAGPGGGAAADRPRRPRRLLRGRGRRGHGGLAARARRHPHAGGLRRHRLRLRRADRRRLPRRTSSSSCRRTARAPPRS